MKPEFTKLLAEVKELTQENCHTDSVLVIATYFKLEKFIKILKAIKTIHEAEGSIPFEIQQYRGRITECVLNFAVKNLTYGEFHKLKSVL